MGNQVAVVMPFYAAIRRSKLLIERTNIVLPVPMGPRVLASRLYRSQLPNSDVPVYLIEHEPYYDRDNPRDGRGLYQQQSGGSKTDYADNAERFVFFSRAVLE